MSEKLSHRADGRGHWPRGRRRTPDSDERREAIAGLHARIADGWSIRGIAGDLKVSGRTLGRWLSGRHHPSPTQKSAASALLVTTTKDAGRRPLQHRVRPY